MATPYGTATREVADRLTAAGIETVTDPRNLNLPGAWLTPAKIDFDRMDPDAYTGTWALYLIARDNGAVESLDELSTMLDALRADMPAAVTEAEAVTVTLANHSPDPLPALLINIDLNVS